MINDRQLRLGIYVSLHYYEYDSNFFVFNLKGTILLRTKTNIPQKIKIRLLALKTLFELPNDKHLPSIHSKWMLNLIVAHLINYLDAMCRSSFYSFIFPYHCSKFLSCSLKYYLAYQFKHYSFKAC